MTKEIHPHRLGLIYAFAALFLWGIHGPAGRFLALQGVNMYVVAALRFWMGAFVFFLYTLRRGHLRKIRFKERLRLVLLIAFVGVALNSLFYHLTLIYLPGTLVMILENLSPVFVLLFSFLLERVRPRFVELLSLALSLGGVLLIVLGKEHFHDLHPLFYFGIFLGILTGMTFGVYVYFSAVLVRPLRGRPDDIVAFLMKIFTITAVLMSPLLLIPGRWPQTFWEWFWLVEMGIFQSGAAYILWNYALSLLPTNETSILFLMTILFTTVNEILFLHLQLNRYLVAGGLLIMAGGYLLTRKRRRRLVERGAV
ncbi:MAG TPA: DMT family transporter [Candidatus Mcinerneyibacteriales bacterium]|nr:DMT family transporter [Candidatus Mcinerneyibacteriales bacterium]